MKLFAALVYLGLAAGVCSPCKAAKAQDSSAAGAKTAVAPPCSDSSIRSKVVALNPNFDVANYGSCDGTSTCSYSPPTQAATPLPSTTYPDDIVAAFDIAPSFFQSELCLLDKIYIDTNTTQPLTNPLAWGLRDRLHSAGSGTGQAKYIGLSITLWDLELQQSEPYAAYENWLLNTLLSPLPPTTNGWVGQFTYNAVPDPAFSSSPSNPKAIAVLGILAHEMGHIVWFDKNVGTMMRCTKASRPQFSLYSWPGSGVVHGFRRLGQQDNNNHTSDGPDLAKILADLRFDSPPHSGKYPDAVNDLRMLYGGGNWASLFATVSLDEDFVETFKLWVLTDTTDAPPREPITALHVTIPTLPAIDILSRFNSVRTKLHAKAQWIQRCLTWP
jgi:hypothetical protein